MYTFVCNINCLYHFIYIFFFKFLGRRTIVFINGARINVNNNNNNNNNNSNDNNNNNNNNNKNTRKIIPWIKKTTVL